MLLPEELGAFLASSLYVEGENSRVEPPVLCDSHFVRWVGWEQWVVDTINAGVEVEELSQGKAVRVVATHADLTNELHNFKYFAITNTHIQGLK